jgi:hypothetical protein
MHLIMQNQRMITVPPIVADAMLTIDNQRIYAQLCQARSDREACLASTDDKDGGIVVTILGGGFPNVEPIRSTEVARISLARGPRRANPLLVPLDLVKRCKQGPCS